MSEACFEPPLFIQAGETTLVDVAKNPFFYNDGGMPTYLPVPPPGVTPLTPVVSSRTDPATAIGSEYLVPAVLQRDATSSRGIATQLGFAGQPVEYAPLWATREVAAAFGITLVEPGQAVKVSSPVATLHHMEYTYGVFAGHQSPYQGTGMALLSVVCTDLEHHDFPHVFASVDPTQPLVIAAGRYWPKRGKIRLADLWLPRGHALYIPPMPANADAECIDLHGNRNSAQACWGSLSQSSIVTRTLLQTGKNTFTHWYWNATATVHGKPAPMG